MTCPATGTTASAWSLPTASASAAISCGETKAGSINSAGQQNSYNFPAVAGDKVLISTASNNYLVDTVAELYDPSGNLLGASTVDGKSGVLALPAAGSYTIVVRDSDLSSIGDYGFSLVFVNGKCGTTTISCGGTRTDDITNPGQQNSYTFPAVAGDKVVISTASNNYLVDTVAELYDPSGNLAGSQRNRRKKRGPPPLSCRVLHDRGPRQ